MDFWNNYYNSASCGTTDITLPSLAVGNSYKINIIVTKHGYGAVAGWGWMYDQAIAQGVVVLNLNIVNPVAPTTLSAKQSSTCDRGLTLSWTGDSSASYYEIYRDASLTPIATTTGTSFTDTTF